MRDGFRQATAWMHGWSGLVLGWLIFAMCLSGSLAVFKDEIGRWARPEISGIADPDAGVAAAVGYLSRHAATAPAWYLTAADRRANTLDAAWADPTAAGGYRRAALDPVTGSPDVARETLGGEFFYRLHFELELPYPIGRMIASLAAAFLLVAIVSGIVAHRRFFADFFLFRSGKGQRSWLDAHNLFGVVALPFHIMITYSGLVTLATLTMPWGGIANYGGDTARMIADFAPAFVEREPMGKPAPLAPLPPMLAEAHRRFGADAQIGQVSIEHPGDRAATVTMTRNDGDQIAMQPEAIVFDGPSGRVIADTIEARPARRAYNVIYGLHMGRFGAGILRWFYFLCGLLLTATIATGLILWTVKRRERAGGGRVHEIVARLNSGVLAGTPVAFMAFFWANRLVPALQPGREQLEVAAVFWVWGAMLLLGLALPARRGMTVILALAAIACAGAPLLTLFDAQAPAPGDHAILGGNLVMLAAAAGFAFGVRQTARRPLATVRPRRARLVEQVPAE